MLRPCLTKRGLNRAALSNIVFLGAMIAWTPNATAQSLAGEFDSSAPPAAYLSSTEESIPATAPPAESIPAVDASLGTSSRLTNIEAQLEQLSYKLEQTKAPAVEKKTELPSFKITGFTQLDGGWFDQSANNRATVGNAQNGVGFRRARLAVVGKAAEQTNYMVEVDFATAGRPSFFDVWVEQMDVPYLGSVRIGQYCQPFSVDAMTGFRDLPFLERALPFLAFVPFRRVGVMAFDISEDERSTWAASCFKTGGFNNAPLGDSRFASDIGDEGGYSFSGRATHVMYMDEYAGDRYFAAVGGSYDFSQMTANTAAGSSTPVPFYQARTAPEFGPLGYSEVPESFGQSFAFNPSFVDTGRYQASNFNMFGLETVSQWGAASFQAEWIGTLVQSVVGPIFYNGAYAEVMYRLTGESRSYDRQRGTLKNVVPFTDFIPLKRDGVVGWGAWEVAGRWSCVSLKNPAALNGLYLNGTSNAGNGVLNDLTAGITWFTNPHSKLQFNYIYSLLDNVNTGHSNASLFVTRAQVDF